MRWIIWLLLGVLLILAIAIATMMIAVARLNPWFARRFARSAAAAALLGFLVEIGLLVCGSHREP